MGGRAPKRQLTQEGLLRLLEILDPDPDRAARKYERLRGRLVRLFEWRGARFPEDLADETIDRVARRLEGGVEIRAEDPYRYFCGVAHLVFKEVLRERRRQQDVENPEDYLPPELPPEEDEGDARMDALQQCLGELSEDHRVMILDYHQGEKRERIENRRAMARRLDIPLNALRIRVHRIRVKLEECVRETVSR